jgi:shikimate kinase
MEPSTRELAITDLETSLPERDAPGPAVILIGPPGSGKSTVGPLLAALLGVEFAETDGLIAQHAGKPVGDIFIDDGEAQFRALEREAVAQAITGQDGVIALGSGAVLDAGTRQRLAGQRVVYLETGFAAVARRTGIDAPHPPLPGNPRARLRALLTDRAALYQELALITAPTDEDDPEQLAEKIAAALPLGTAQPGGTP